MPRARVGGVGFVLPYHCTIACHGLPHTQKFKWSPCYSLPGEEDMIMDTVTNKTNGEGATSTEEEELASVYMGLVSSCLLLLVC